MTMLYEKSEHKVYVSYSRKRKGRSTEMKRWDFEPVALIPNFGKRNDPFFVVVPDTYPQWFLEYLDTSRYHSEEYAEDEVLVLRNESYGSSKYLFYRQYMEHFILQVFTESFVPNENIDYSPYRDQLLSHIEVVGWNLFNQREKLKDLHNIKVEYDVVNPNRSGAIHFDMLNVADVEMEDQVAAFVETLIDDTDYIASGENESENIQSVLASIAANEPVEDLDNENEDDEPVTVDEPIEEEVAEENEPEIVESDVKPVAVANVPVTLDITIDQEAIVPVANNDVDETITEESESVGVDLHIEPITTENESVAFNLDIQPAADENEPVMVELNIKSIEEEVEPVALNLNVETEEIEAVAINLTVEPVTEEIEPVAIDVPVEVVPEEIETVVNTVSEEAITEDIEPLFNNDDDFDLFILDSKELVAPKPKRGRKSKVNLAQTSLF